MKALAPRDRPVSTATDIYDDTDFEYDESDNEEDEEEAQNSSPRFSLHSVSTRSVAVNLITMSLMPINRLVGGVRLHSRLSKSCIPRYTMV